MNPLRVNEVRAQPRHPLALRPMADVAQTGARVDLFALLHHLHGHALGHRHLPLLAVLHVLRHLLLGTTGRRLRLGRGFRSGRFRLGRLLLARRLSAPAGEKGRQAECKP